MSHKASQKGPLIMLLGIPPTMIAFQGKFETAVGGGDKKVMLRGQKLRIFPLDSSPYRHIK